MEGLCFVTSDVTVFYKKNIIPVVKHGGGGVMVWDCNVFQDLDDFS